MKPHQQVMREGKLWEVIGKVQALSDPEGPIATTYAISPDEALRQIWQAVRDLRP